MVQVNGAAEKVYSSDGKLWAGMTVEEGYKKNYELFNFADKDGDEVLSEKEIQRYDGPILVVNREDKAYRFMGTYHGRTGFMMSHHGQVSGDIIADRECEFYPGLELGDVKDQEFNMVFSSLDLDKDRKLSAEEMKKYYDYVARKEEYAAKQKEIKQEYGKQVSKHSWAPVAMSFGGALGCVLLGGLGISLADGIRNNFLRGTAKAVSFVGSVGGALALVLAIANGNAKRCQEKYLHPMEQKLDREFADLKRQDAQYKNVYQN